jgi:hypothetical protein
MYKEYEFENEWGRTVIGVSNDRIAIQVNGAYVLALTKDGIYRHRYADGSGIKVSGKENKIKDIKRK